MRRLILRREHQDDAIRAGLAVLFGIDESLVQDADADPALVDAVRFHVVRHGPSGFQTDVGLYLDETKVTIPRRSADLALRAAVHFSDDVLTNVDGVADNDPSPFIYCLARPSGELLLVVETDESDGGDLLAINEHDPVRVVEPAPADSP